LTQWLLGKLVIPIMRKFIHILVVSFWLMMVSAACSAQESDFTTIRGTITEEVTGEPMILTNVVLFQDGKQVGGAASDFDGRYKFRLEKAGTYSIKASFVGYEMQERLEIELEEAETKTVDIEMKGGVELPEVVVNASLGEQRIIACGIEVLTIYGRRITTEVEEENVISSFSLFPNPATTEITFDLSGLVQEPLSLRIIDANGRIVLEQQAVQLSGRLTVPLDGLSNGVYFASVQLQDKLLTERFVVAR
jgi:hypothetical protein